MNIFPSIILTLQLSCAFASTQPVQFALLPGQFDLSTWSNPTATSATDPQQCLDLAWYADDSTQAFSFDNATGECKYASVVNGYAPYKISGPPDYYLRCDTVIRDNSTCLSNQDGEYLVMTQTYGNLSCPRADITQFADAGMCYDTLSSGPDYGVYTGGYYLNGTKLLLTRDQANDAVSWQCTGAFWKMMFNFQWYCFITYGIAQGDGKYSMIADNFCGTQTSGSSSVVVNDGRLFLWLYNYYPWAPQYIGLILDNTTNAFKWYDNTLQNVPWAAGCPNNTNGNKTLAIVDSSGNVCDEDPLQMTALTCWWLATSQPYDSTARFY